MKLNLGSGPYSKPGWVNVDYSIGARLSRIPLVSRCFNYPWDRSLVLHDLCRPFPWKTDSADAIYCSHFLEHIPRSDATGFLAECRRVLKPGCPIRIIVPDLAAIIDKHRTREVPADRFLEALATSGPRRKNIFARLLAPLLDNPHLCMYDEQALGAAMAEAGLLAVRRNPFDSDIPEIDAIELEDRTNDAVIMEARK